MLYRYFLRSRALISTMVVGVSLIIRAQDAAPPSVDLYSGQNQPEATATPSSESNGPELPEISQLDQTFSKPKSLGKDADALRLHIEWRQLKNRIVRSEERRVGKES